MSWAEFLSQALPSILVILAFSANYLKSRANGGKLDDVKNVQGEVKTAINGRFDLLADRVKAVEHALLQNPAIPTAYTVPQQAEPPTEEFPYARHS